MPAQPPTAPRLRTSLSADGTVVLRAEIPGCAGLPVAATVRGPDSATTVWGAAGSDIRLPLRAVDAGRWTVACRELASGLASELTLDHPVQTPPPAPAITVRVVGESGLVAFASRRDRELVVALTAAQAADPTVVALAERLRAHYAAAGRRVRLGRADPSDVVLHQQAIEPLLHFPRWHSIDADLVLLGSPAGNVLLFDQARGGLLPTEGPALVHAWSPFRGMCHVVNVLGRDATELEQAVAALPR